MTDLPGLILLILRLGLVAVLYAFLAWSLILIWRDLRQHSQHLFIRHMPPLLFKFDGDAEDLRFTLPRIFIGRDPICECYLPDETISSKHAVLNYRQGQWWLEDLGSSNGTLLNDKALTDATVLTNGDTVQCGQVSFSIWLES